MWTPRHCIEQGCLNPVGEKSKTGRCKPHALALTNNRLARARRDTPQRSYISRHIKRGPYRKKGGLYP